MANRALHGAICPDKVHVLRHRREGVGPQAARPSELSQRPEEKIMERVVTLHIEKLPEGVYLATSDDVNGLVAQGRTIQEAIEIARDVAKKLIGMQDGDANDLRFPPAQDSFEYPLIVNT
jgi:predicted RNase H-like HicB family nuclease